MNSRGPEQVRPAAVAGRFYPADPDELQKLVEGLLAAVEPTASAPKALIVPHAGFPFSGPVAASAYAQWRSERGAIRRVVLLGPSHRIAFAGVATVSCSAFATPLGLTKIDSEWVAKATGLPGVVVSDEAHAYEHSLEVQLPFLQSVLGKFSLVPLLAGEVSSEQVGSLLDHLWGGPETRIVVSSDLSHYLNWPAARALDQATAAAIEGLEPEKIGREQACGRTAVLGLLHAARRRGLRVRTFDLRNSGDTAGPRDRVVGYGAFGFLEPTPEPQAQNDHDAK